MLSSYLTYLYNQFQRIKHIFFSTNFYTFDLLSCGNQMIDMTEPNVRVGFNREHFVMVDGVLYRKGSDGYLIPAKQSPYPWKFLEKEQSKADKVSKVRKTRAKKSSAQAV